MKKIFTSAIVLLLLASVLIVGCTADPETIIETIVVTEEVVVEKEVVVEVPAEEEDVTITYFTFSAAPDHLEDLDEMISIFEAENPKIHIEVQTASYDDYFTKLQTRIAGGDAPDVFELNYESFVSYAAKGVLLNLEPLAQADPDYDASIYYQRALDAFNYKGMQLGLPETFSTVMLYYNQDLFDSAGVAYPAADWTWDDVIVAGKALMEGNEDVWGIHSSIHFWEFYKKAAQNNCQFFNEDQTEVLLTSPECVVALETMISLLDEGVMPTNAEMGGVSDGDLFISGDLGMLVSGIWMFSAFEENPFNWDIQVEPGMATQATHFFANAVNVFAGTKNAEAAYEWVKFFTSDPAMAEIRIDSAWELPALNNPDYVAGYLLQSPPENRQAVFDSLEYAIVPPVIERQNEMTDVIGAALDQAVLGAITPLEALEQAKAGIEALLP
ncbi:MAG: sugar ABC transporter substrate-binding protein [Bacteroidetes bacterium]|nr:sugar ABC transporter substrate-binding protein [Bacteroidota bacterium]